MTPSELKYEVEKTNSVFFTRASMSFFGDTMKNYGVRQTEVSLPSADRTGVYVDTVYELYRKKPVKYGLRKSVFFDRFTFKTLYPVGE